MTKHHESANSPSKRVLCVESLFATLEALRHPETGCPWDRKQTIESMIEPLREEVEELAEAVAQKDTQNIAGEAGDVLWNILTILQIAREDGLFSPQDVADAMTEKMVARHPHVFGDETAMTVDEAHAAYQAAKEQEKTRSSS